MFGPAVETSVLRHPLASTGLDIVAFVCAQVDRGGRRPAQGYRPLGVGGEVFPR